MKNQFAMCYEDGRVSKRFDTLQEAVAHVAMAHDGAELSPDGKDVRVHIGPLVLGKIVQRKGWDN